MTYEHDRAHGKGLPANLDDSALTRIARGIARVPQVRVASAIGAIARGYEPVDGEPGHYRRGHTIWALRPAEDGEGHVLIRQREEPAADMRQRQAKAPPGPRTVGDRVTMEREGQLADAMIVFVNPAKELADVVFEGSNEHECDVPMDDMMEPSPDGMMIELLAPGGGDPFAPELEPSSKEASLYDIPTPGTYVMSNHAIALPLHGEGAMLDADMMLKLDGYSPADSERTDRLYGIPNPIEPGPGDHASDYIRVRLQNEATGEMYFVLAKDFTPQSFEIAESDVPMPDDEDTDELMAPPPPDVTRPDVAQQ